MMVIGFPHASPGAYSLQSNRGNDVVDVHGASDLTNSPEEEEEEAPKRTAPTFILDSGASRHATSVKCLLSNIVSLAFACTLPSAAYQRSLTPPVIAGSVVSEKFQLAGVIYAPDLAPGTVLVSVRQLAALGYVVVFGRGRCIVRSGRGGEVVGEGRLGDDGLYRLEFLKIPLDAAVTDDGEGRLAERTV